MKKLTGLVLGLAAMGLAALSTVSASRAAPPEGIVAVTPFDVERYLGQWYEIARLDHRFERGLTNVTADYSLRSDSSLRVLNRGYDTGDCEFTEREGRARFEGSPDTASLSVTFFWPFAGGYHVFILDEDYRYAAVSGPDRSYLWILSRTPQLPEPVLRDIVARAGEAGFPVADLIYVPQGEPVCERD
jgi:apolipoprotein D and lipocalin family protein